MNQKKCKNCKVLKDTSEYYEQSKKLMNGSPCLYGKCKDCMKDDKRRWREKNRQRVNEKALDWYRSVNGYRCYMWNGIVQRCGNHPHYRHVEIKMTKQEWYDFATPLIKQFLEDNPGATPSVDRIDPQGHYEPSNLRIIKWEENLTRSNVLLSKLGVDMNSTMEEKVDAIRKIIEGQCELLGISPQEVLEQLGEERWNEYL